MTPTRFRWGLIFILAGVLVLLVKTDVIIWEYWEGSFFLILALFLIAIGIEKIFNHTRLQFISYLSSVLFVAAVLFLAFEATNRDSDMRYSNSMTIQEAMESGIAEVSAYVDLGEDDLTVRESTKDLFWARFDKYSGKPRYDYSIEDGRAVITVKPSARRFFGGLVIHYDREYLDEWRMKFSDNAPLELKVHGENSYIHLNLSDTPLRMLDVDADDADIYLRVGSLLPDVKITAEGRDSHFKLRVPRESGLKVSGFDDTGYLERAGLDYIDGNYFSKGYDTVSARIEVDLDNRFSSLSIEYY